jgi:Trk-type K+ transport system membrane component
MSLMFKICIGLFIFTIAPNVARWVQLSKYIDTISASEDNIKSKILKSHKLLITVYKWMFLISPIYIIIIYIIYTIDRKDTVNAIWIIVVIYLSIIQDYFFRKKVLSRLNQ